MTILSFEKPKKLRSADEHQEMYKSDTNIAGTYVPNMSREDELKWKAKHIKNGGNPRIEIRKTIAGREADPKAYQGERFYSSQVLIVITTEAVKISTNGTMWFDEQNWNDLQRAVAEARAILYGNHTKHDE